MNSETDEKCICKATQHAWPLNQCFQLWVTLHIRAITEALPFMQVQLTLHSLHTCICAVAVIANIRFPSTLFVMCQLLLTNNIRLLSTLYYILPLPLSTNICLSVNPVNPVCHLPIAALNCWRRQRGVTGCVSRADFQWHRLSTVWNVNIPWSKAVTKSAIVPYMFSVWNQTYLLAIALTTNRVIRVIATITACDVTATTFNFQNSKFSSRCMTECMTVSLWFKKTTICARTFLRWRERIWEPNTAFSLDWSLVE